MSGNNKIAFVIQSLGIGGAEKFLVNVVNHFQRNGYKPVLILLSENKQLLPELEHGIKIWTILKRSRFDLFVSSKIKAVIKEEGINKIFCINTYSFFLAKLSLLFDQSVSFFVSLHSTIPFSRKYYWQNLIYFRLITRRDTIIYLCNNQKKYLRKKYYLSKTTEHVVYNGIDTAYFNPDLFLDMDKALIKHQYDLTIDDKVIVLVARFQAEKRHRDAIDALGILHHTYHNKSHLLLVGSGEDVYTNTLKQYVRTKQLDSFVHFTGSQSDVRKFYTISDVFTLTSNSETFSLAALEAMAFGLPCSLTNVGGAGEMMIEGTTGALSNPEDPVSIAESWNRLLRSNLKGKNIRQFVLDKFSSERMLNQYIELVGKNQSHAIY